MKSRSTLFSTILYFAHNDWLIIPRPFEVFWSRWKGQVSRMIWVPEVIWPFHCLLYCWLSLSLLYYINKWRGTFSLLVPLCSILGASLFWLYCSHGFPSPMIYLNSLSRFSSQAFTSILYSMEIDCIVRISRKMAHEINMLNELWSLKFRGCYFCLRIRFLLYGNFSIFWFNVFPDLSLLRTYWNPLGHFL